MKKKILFILSITLILFMHANTIRIQAKSEINDDTSIKLRILETTDIHSYLLNYDYEKKKKTIEYGYNRVASLIQQAKKEHRNTLLFDVGDVIKGSPIAEYVASSPMFYSSDIHPAYKSMNVLGYDAATFGNHEFNYGLDFLINTIKGADFPYTNANIYVDDRNDYEQDDIHFFQPYLLIDKEVINEKGEMDNVKVGVIGLITPITQQWDKAHFDNKLIIKNMRKTAEEIVPKMKKEGADIIIALVHAGLESDQGYRPKSGNNVRDISKVEGIDVILYGHSHGIFPVKGAKGPKGVNHEKGLINGKPTVQAGNWGNHLGIIDLTLQKKKEKWIITKSKSTAKPIIRIIKKKKIPIVSPMPEMEYILSRYHEETLEYMKSKSLLNHLEE
ncbi:metallophosphoesterase [Niallia sp. FSL W8-0635]|uniref:metallophosphoesterase n=1 Tax=Niallia sp. FSL W8-0635 TaxID=2975337 RepID=UPI0009D0358B|nr:2',3'-cyclic-nucleotide 2'-phosphodiesterase/3'-nucleotidase precursor [Mycobacteroides abscessus subsp. abscessus]HEO8419180.1 metallophosphoesterase [Yersinia enterocolitica]